MLNSLSLDHLRSFIAAVDEGSFSAAARKLLRAQSVVSQNIANLEDQIGVALFYRSGRYPHLTTAGTVLLADARDIIDRIDGFKSRAKAISSGLEPELSVVVDVMFPMSAITLVCQEFARVFPATPLRLHVEALGAVAQQVLSGECDLGIIGSLPEVPHALRAERVIGMLMVMVVAPSHPLARHTAPLTRAQLSDHVQLVLTDHSQLSEGRSFGVMSSRTWKLTDLGAKHAFLLAGLGWGGMPKASVATDLEHGKLVALDIEDTPPGGMILPMSLVYPAAAPPGPAGRWFVDRLRECALDFDHRPDRE